jgi:hypothetical protein
MSGNEQLHARVYGTDPDAPDEGPRPGCGYVALVGGPLDGLLLDVTCWTADNRAGGSALIAEQGR